ncbi:MAG TPA: aromatic ring-hydroxylating dioxygenase subunit alpha [Leptolyngbyaceae cyanobacterium]
MTEQILLESPNTDKPVLMEELPGHCYTDPQFFIEEREKIWYKSWLFVGRQEDLVNPGDYLSCKVGDEPIIVTRTNSGKLQAMYNVCVHRGMRLLEGQGNCKHIICPYHHWSYNLEGKLEGVVYPQCFPNLDKTAIALPQVQVDTWGGFVFVNLDPEAPSLKDYLAGVPQHLERYSHSWQGLRIAHRATYEIAANWKILMENYIDAYHIPMVHGPTLAADFDLPGFIKGSMTGLHIIQEYEYKVPKEPTYIGYIFPSMPIITLERNIVVWQFNPINPGLTVIEKFLYQSPEQMEKFPLKTDGKKPLKFAEVFAEDIPINLMLQEQVKSRAYPVKQPLAQGPEDGIAYIRKAVKKLMQIS